jgi:MFS family permease
MGHPRILIAALALLAVGIVLAAVGNVWVSAVGWGLFGIGGVVLVSLAFLLVGESEDRDRIRNPRG